MSTRQEDLLRRIRERRTRRVQSDPDLLGRIRARRAAKQQRDDLVVRAVDRAFERPDPPEESPTQVARRELEERTAGARETAKEKSERIHRTTTIAERFSRDLGLPLTRGVPGPEEREAEDRARRLAARDMPRDVTAEAPRGPAPEPARREPTREELLAQPDAIQAPARPRGPSIRSLPDRSFRVQPAALLPGGEPLVQSVRDVPARTTDDIAAAIEEELERERSEGLEATLERMRSRPRDPERPHPTIGPTPQIALTEQTAADAMRRQAEQQAERIRMALPPGATLAARAARGASDSPLVGQLIRQPLEFYNEHVRGGKMSADEFLGLVEATGTERAAEIVGTLAGYGVEIATTGRLLGAAGRVVPGRTGRFLRDFDTTRPTTRGRAAVTGALEGLPSDVASAVQTDSPGQVPLGMALGAATNPLLRRIATRRAARENAPGSARPSRVTEEPLPATEVPQAPAPAASEAVPDAGVPWRERRVEPAQRGKLQRTVFPGDESKVETEFALVEADQIRASHTPDFTQRPPEEFPPEIQGRAYHGPRGRQAREHTESIVSSFDPDRALDPTVSAADGPPVVTAQGINVAGNGRTIAMQRVWQNPERGEQLIRKPLLERAAEFGLDPDMVRGMRKPILVRRVTDPSVDITDVQTLRRLNAASDVPTGKAKDVLSDAASRAKQFRSASRAIAHFAETAAEDATIRSYLGTGDGREFMRRLVEDGVISKSERARFVDATSGAATDEGKQLVERMFYAAAIGDADVVARAPEGVLRKLDTALPGIIRSELVEGWGVGGLVRESLDLLASARAQNLTLDDLVAQVDIVRAPPADNVVAMARFLERSPKASIRDAFRAYAEEAESFGRQTASDDMFGHEPRPAGEAQKQFAALRASGGRREAFDRLVGREAAAARHVQAIQEGRVSPLTPMRDLFGEEVRAPEAQGELLPTGPQGMSTALDEARATVSTLEGKVQRGQATADEVRRFQEARSLVRRSEGRGLDEGELARQREGTPARREPDDTGDLFAMAPKASERLRSTGAFLENESAGPVTSPVQIIRDLNDAVGKALEGLKVAEGKFPRGFKKAFGIINTRTQVIRLQDLSDVAVFGHEAGHAMQKLMFGSFKGAITEDPLLLLPGAMRGELEDLARGISDESLKEGWAEFWRRYLDNPEALQTEAPNALRFIEKKLEDYPEVRNAWQVARDEWTAFRESSAYARVASKVSVGDREPDVLSIDDRWSRFRTAVLDDFEPIRRVVEHIREKVGIDTIAEDAEQLARLSRGSVGVANHFLEHGTLSFGSLRKTGPGLKQILEPVMATLDEFRTYAVARRAQELHARQIQTGFRPADVDTVVQQLEDRFGDTFRAAFQGLQRWNRSLLKYLVDAGVITRQSYDTILELNQSFVPYYRVREGRSVGGSMALTYGHLFSPVKRIKGSGRDLVDPLESMVKNAYSYVHLAQRQQVSRALASLASKEGVGPILEQLGNPIRPVQLQFGEIERQLEKIVPGLDAIMKQVRKAAEAKYKADTRGMTEGEIAMAGIVKYDPAEELLAVFRPGDYFSKPNMISVLEGGKRRWYEVDPELYAALEGLDRETVDSFSRFMGSFSRTLRAGATLAPEFLIRNPIRDQVMAFIQSEYGYVPFVDMARGIFEIVRKGEAYQQWLSAGGYRAALTALDRDAMQNSLRELLKAGGVANVVKHPLDALRALSALLEDGTRVGEFMNARKVLGTSKEALQEAAAASREISIDFARHGAKTGFLRQAVAFWNARIQGYDRLARAAKRNPVQFTAKAFTLITVPSLLEYAMNRDDPEYWELPQWQRDLFWMVKVGESWLSIPKPFELGLIFGTLPVRVLDSIVQGPGGGEEMGTFFRETLLREAEGFNPFAFTAISPIYESMANYSFFLRRPIVPRSQEEVRARFQVGPSTSEVAELLARWSPGEEGISPRTIDNALYAWTGGLGRLGTEALGFALPDDRARRPSRRVSELPGVRGVMDPPPGFSSESIERFYRDYERARSAVATLRHFDRIGDAEAYERELADAKFAELRQREPALRRAADELAELRAEADAIRRDPDMDPNEKREQTDALGREAAAIARTALGRELPDSR